MGTDATTNSSPGDSFFTYDGSRNVIKRHVTEQGSTKTIYQQGGVELIKEGNSSTIRRNIGNAIVEVSGNTATTRYVYTDHLGSVDVITNAAGLIEQKLSFDAFGKRRQVFSQSNQPVAITLSAILNLTHRGFTGHLQVDHASIIHMGGRIYDAHIGRFLQADPFVQAPSNSQSHNRYSYVLNNPLSYTDPSGYFFKKLKQFAAVIVGAALIYFTGGTASWFMASWYGAATAGAIAGAVGAAVNGGNILKGAVWGAFSAAAFYGVGSAFGEVAFGSGAHMLKTAAHGLVGGVMNTLQGGKFGHGFAAAGVAQFAAPGIDGIDAGNDFSAGRIALSAIAGGTASKLSGGKFANGAVTDAFSRMFNDEAKHQWQRSLQAAQEEQLAVGAATKALGKVLGSSRLDLGIEIDSNGNITTSASANLDKLKISINSDMQATVLAGGPDGLVGQSFSVHDGAAQKAVASYRLIELSVASFDNGVINYDVQLGAGAYIRYSGGFDLRNWGATGQYIRAVHARESSFNNYVCKNLRGVQGC